MAVEKKEAQTNSYGGLAVVGAIVFLIFVIFIIFFFYPKADKTIFCGDGTVSGECSSTKPYFCSGDVLVEDVLVCGCPENFSVEDGKCVSSYQKYSREILFSYVLRGEAGEINFVAYKEVVNYVSELPTSIIYTSGENSSRADFVFLKIDDGLQRDFLMPLVVDIQKITSDKEDQARIAISLVQKIPFGDSGRTVEFINGKNLTYARYPYEIVYDFEGVCGEKVALLAFILRELGYGAALFYYPEQNHEVLGIACPFEYSLEESGFCFVETTGPSIITNEQSNYVGGLVLSNREIIPLFEGDSLMNLYEYKDAKKFIELDKIVEEKGELNLFQYSRWEKFIEKYGMGSG